MRSEPSKPPRRGNSEANHTVVERMLREIAIDGKLTKRDITKFRGIYGSRFMRGLRLALDGRVKRYIFKPSGRELWVVVGESREYLILPHAPYCSCDDYYYAVMDGKAMLCQHLIAYRIASQLGIFDKVEEEDNRYGDLIAELKEIMCIEEH
ncbi:hypothetical protein B6U84_04060 [Candidatus Bathyarchaeota archaeon ex4484_40]|nr:MAG: hypothetical protein B6U84_04060 [Candidatus Bathyarchaeota archaeon ex4484_40]